MHRTCTWAAAALLAAGLSATVMTPSAEAVPARVFQVPNGAVNSCGTCHENQTGSGPRNAFGNDVEANLDGTEVDWAAIFDIDSDGDGFTNGQELGDPEGQWLEGDPDPDGEITNPGDDSDVPSTGGTSNGTSNGTSAGTTSTSGETTDGGGDDEDDEGCAVAPGQTHSSAALLMLLGCVLGFIRRRR